MYFMLLIMLIYSCASNRKSLENKFAGRYSANKEIYNPIVSLDSIFGEAYNSSNLDIQTELNSDSVELFHDQPGLIKSKQIILDATKSNICGKIRRELVKGSIEKYPISGFEAGKVGMNRFHKIADNESTSPHPGRFKFIWQHQNNNWLIRSAISQHD